MINSIRPVNASLLSMLGAVACLFLLAGCSHVTPQSQAPTPWIELFDGETLKGWSQVNGDAPYVVLDGVIRGTNVLDSPNSFLASDEVYSDFVLEFESRSIGEANSGVQFRTELAPGTWSGVVGYQLDIDPSPRKWTGGLYHEGVHVWRHSMARNPACQAAYMHGEWNTYRIEAVGPVIATWVNDIPCAHMVGDHHRTGFVALQVHAINEEEKYRGNFTEWRKVRLLDTPETNDLWLTQRADLIEGWLDNQLSDSEAEKGWRLFDISNESATLDVGSGDFEIVMDVRLDNDADGQLEYEFAESGDACSGSYKILNDASLGEGRSASSLMGSYPDKYAAENLSEPGRPKRVYSSERWNRVRIVVDEDRIQHWLNSVKVVDYPRCDSSAPPSSAAGVILSLVTHDGQIEVQNTKIKTAP